jgi:hypothetical protein
MKRAMQETDSLKDFLRKFRDIGPKNLNFKAGTECPNCHKGFLEITPLVKSFYELRYIYKVICYQCGFACIQKVAITGAGKSKSIDFTQKEIDILRMSGIKI